MNTIDSDTYLQQCKSNYAYMNEWMTKDGQKTAQREFTHPFLSNCSKRSDGLRAPSPASRTRCREEPSSFVQPVHKDKFLKMCDDLSDQIAHRYPNHGLPKTRTGCMGASWRHVKQVTQHVGTPLLYLDGIVRQYDACNMNSRLHQSGQSRCHVSTPLYCPNKHDMAALSRSRSWHNDIGTVQIAPDPARLPAMNRSNERRFAGHSQTPCFQ